jgi:hypothetical protein
MLPYVAWIAIWQAMYDPRLWIAAGSSPANARKAGSDVADHFRLQRSLRPPGFTRADGQR